MIKKVALTLLSLAFATSFVLANEPPLPNEKNDPTVGSRQSSSQQFGNQPLVGKAGQKYSTSGVKTHSKIDSVGSRQASNQLFGNPPLTHKTKASSNAKKRPHRVPNNPTVGSKQGSNQVFGNPPLTEKQDTK